MKINNEDIIEEKIEKTRFKTRCQLCHEEIMGTSEKHLLSNFRTHLKIKHERMEREKLEIKK